MKAIWSACLVAMFCLAGCGSGGGDSSPIPLPDEDGPSDSQALPRADVRGLERLRPYRADGAYADVLKACVLIDSSSQACSLEVLPFLAQATPDFTREDILDRLLVTHEWMGKRFEKLLADAPEHMVTLFGSLTSIAIGSTVRPSNYWGATGGMRIDPDYLWLSVEEKASVSIEEDYRSDYGRDLQFWSFGSLRRQGKPATWYYSLSDYTTRTLDEIRLPVFRLLYHELAHAVDFLPSDSFATLDAQLTPRQRSMRTVRFGCRHGCIRTGHCMPMSYRHWRRSVFVARRPPNCRRPTRRVTSVR